MRRYRIGLALTFGQEHRLLIDGLRLALGGFGVGRIEPHITLVPPSNIHVDDIESEIYRLRKLASQQTPFQLMIGPSGSFYPDSPVLYLAVSGPGVERTRELVDLINQRDIYRRDSRRYVPHVTLADGVPTEKLQASLKTIDSEVLRARVDCLQMMVAKSQANWEVFSDFRFIKARRVHRGGLQLEVFSHQSGDIAIYKLVEGVRVSQSKFWASSDPRLRLDGQRFCQISIYAGGVLVACGSAAYSSVFALVRAIAVKQEFQRLAIGSLLIEELLYQLQLLGVEKVYAVSDFGNERFLSKSGAVQSPDWPQFLNYENGMTLNSWSFSRR